MPFKLSYTSVRAQLGLAKWSGNIDGDTPTVTLNIRMLGIDTHELHYPGTAKPSKYNDVLKKLLTTHKRFFRPGLREYLEPKLAGDPGYDQERWGQIAKEKLRQIAEKHLAVKNPRTGRISRKKIYLTTGEQTFDRYKRLLAYVAPEEKNPAKRITFNLLLIQNGIAVNYIIFPNLPKPKDLELVQKAVVTARKKKFGFWQEYDHLLLPLNIDIVLTRRLDPVKAQISSARISQQVNIIILKNITRFCRKIVCLF